MNATRLSSQAIGLGLRREFFPELHEHPHCGIDFFELAPENWIGFGGRAARQLRQLTEAYPFICHGLSLSIGGPTELDWALLDAIRDFMAEHHIQHYSEHLAYTADYGQLYDLLPLPFTEEMLHHVANRILQVQDYLKMPLIIENTVFYGGYRHSTMDELEFLLALLQKTGCQLLLDLNNLQVNACNQQYDPVRFLHALPAERIVYQHVAGHVHHAEGWLIDTHDHPVDEAVWGLLRTSHALFGSRPTLLEWDNRLPPLPDLLEEARKIGQISEAIPGI